MEKFKRRQNDDTEANFCGRFNNIAMCNGKSSYKLPLESENLPTHIIIDCSMFSYIDSAGVSILKTTVQEYESIGVKTFLASCATHVVRMLEKDHFYEEVPPHHVYISVHDAVHHALDDQNELAAKKDANNEENQNDIKVKTLEDDDRKSLTGNNY